MFYNIGFQKNGAFRFFSIVCFSLLLIACGGEESTSTEQAQASSQSSQSITPNENQQETSEQEPEEVVEDEPEVPQEEAPQSEPVEQPELSSSIELNWSIPVAREDGSDLELYEIDGYVIAYGTSEEHLDEVVNVLGSGQTSAVIEDLVAGTYYFSIATLDVDGNQSAFSDAIEQVVL